jgi:hypothetical protein
MLWMRRLLGALGARKSADLQAEGEGVVAQAVASHPHIVRGVAGGVVAVSLTAMFFVYRSMRARPADPVIAEIRAYSQTQYGGGAFPVRLSDAELAQLSVLQPNTVSTPEAGARIAARGAQPFDQLNIEIRRALARVYCLQLLRRGGQEAYQAFVAAQPEAGRLTFDAFQQLSAWIRARTPLQMVALRASCFLTISDHARRQAGTEAPADSEQFLTWTMDPGHHPAAIYPVYAALPLDARALMPVVYLGGSHVRHMLYTEGGHTMFNVLRQQIRARALDQEAYEVWFMRWVINIAGFRGHVDARGSAYLTQTTFDDLRALKGQLDRLWEDVDYDVFGGYLEVRQEELEVNSLFLAHAGALMRLHTRPEGQALQAWFDGLSAADRAAYEAAFEQFRTIGVTPTYGPAVLDQLGTLGATIAERMAIYASIHAAAMAAYTEGIAARRIAEETPLSFRGAANSALLEALLANYRRDRHLPEGGIPLIVDRQGEIQIERPTAAATLRLTGS